MAKKAKKQQPKPVQAPAHGACPTCGHCKCCEQTVAPTFVPYWYPYQPYWQIETASPNTTYEYSVATNTSTNEIKAS